MMSTQFCACPSVHASQSQPICKLRRWPDQRQEIAFRPVTGALHMNGSYELHMCWHAQVSDKEDAGQLVSLIATLGSE